MFDANRLLGRNIFRDPFFHDENSWAWVNTGISDPLEFSDVGVTDSGRSVIIPPEAGHVLKTVEDYSGVIKENHTYFSGVYIMYRPEDNTGLFQTGAKFDSFSSINDMYMTNLTEINQWGMLTSYGQVNASDGLIFTITRQGPKAAMKGYVHIGAAFLVDLTDIFGEEVPSEEWCKNNISLKTLFGIENIKKTTPSVGDSILLTIKKLLGNDEYYDVFHVDIITAINSSLMVLNQLGVGPKKPYHIKGIYETWKDFLGEKLDDLEAVISYVYLKSKLIFDPPSSGVLHEAMEREIQEYEWRLNVQVETPPEEDDQAEITLEGGDQNEY